MPEPTNVTRATLQEIRLGTNGRDSQPVGTPFEVPFNPETLKVTYANTMAGGDQAGGAARQWVGQSTTKLAVELWFDASATSSTRDVRELTNQVQRFLRPTVRQGEGMVPPPLRFAWGSFLFEGVLESMDETIEYFSADGRPLRSKVSISVVSQDLQSRIADGALEKSQPGTTPQLPAAQGQGLQQMLGEAGRDPEGWQQVARANGIENPRLLPPGAFVNPFASGGR